MLRSLVGSEMCIRDRPRSSKAERLYQRSFQRRFRRRYVHQLQRRHGHLQQKIHPIHEIRGPRQPPSGVGNDSPQIARLRVQRRRDVPLFCPRTNASQKPFIHRRFSRERFIGRLGAAPRHGTRRARQGKRRKEHRVGEKIKRPTKRDAHQTRSQMTDARVLRTSEDAKSL